MTQSENDTVTLPKEQFDQLINKVISISKAESDVLYTTREACKYLKCSSVTFWKIRKEQNASIHPVYVRGKMFFRKSILDQYLNRS
jgi:hypothetical protein